MSHTGEFIEFVRLPAFAETIGRLLEAGDQREVELLLLEDPLRGEPIRDTGGFRWMQVGMPPGEKKERVGVVYYYVPHRERVYLVLAHRGREAEELTEAERRRIRDLGAIIDRERY